MNAFGGAVDPQGVRTAHELGAWNQIVAESFLGTTVDADDQRFKGDLANCKINHLTLTRVRAQPSKVQRWLRDGPGPSSGSLLLHLQVSGTAISEQWGHRTVMQADEGVICDPDHSYNIDLPTDYDRFIVELPMPVLVARAPDFDVQRYAGRLIDSRRSSLLIAFLNAAWFQRDCLDTDADWRECVSRTATDLALRAIGLMEPAGGGRVRSKLQRAVIEHVLENLTDPMLRTSTIAQAMGVSPRSIQNVFENMATTASAFILERRMNLAAKRLIADPVGQSITDHALDCGFFDPSYFSRCFQHTFGVSPRTYRRQKGLPGSRSSSE